MTGEFHDDLRGDADGEHEADECLTAAVRADKGVFWIGLVIALAITEAGDMDRLVETTELSKNYCRRP